MSERRSKVAHAALRTYKLTLSPAFQVFGAQCRHVPSCSEYCADCVSRHGLWTGGWMTLARLSRCRPGGSSGYDPVPEKADPIPVWAPWRAGDWARTQRPFPDAGPETN
ncbi:membrane protein insertion efficiency factor YidD [Henriciella barbarensis]|uniref:Putative membrane protein insertion efficiency factor n=1 Tax=Henriciella barbarensis TaxID=86342 RepID=A0A399R3K9_9PROT|nr:membrane protein insertion efficiency factor YidD [Henriciella barbarensis]RIJ24302.1 membrane protein insertion efficiency factor YidD [Henriciella barbarensis]